MTSVAYTADDAGRDPASRAASAKVSVIVPVFNRADELAPCLSAILGQMRDGDELIVVDDGSTDGSGEIAAAAGAELVVLSGNSGAAEARNAGARRAQGDILVFVDSDVVIERNVIIRMVEALAADRTVDAVFGSYDASPAAPGIVSQFRNLLHHYTHQVARPEASTFWAGCGAVWRSAFEKLGGFDARWEGIEDLEFGRRLHEAGARIRLDRTITGTHLKAWSLSSMARTDFFMRAVPWSRLIAERGASNDLNVRSSQRFSVALAAALVAAVAALPLAGTAAAAVGILCATGIVAANFEFYRFLGAGRGGAFALAAFPLHLVYFWVAGAGACFAAFDALRSRETESRP